MRSIRLLVAGLAIIAVAGCATTTPGWTYAPASASAAPSVEAGASVEPSGPAAPSASASAAAGATATPSGSAPAEPSGSAPAEPSGAPTATVIDLAALNIAFDPTTLSAPAGAPFQIKFANNDTVPHNVEIKDASGASVFKGEIFSGIGTRTYDVPALTAGTYQFVCDVHPNMVGTLTAG
jgi:plastocyanin